MIVLFYLILFRKYNQIGFEMAAQGRVNNRGREREGEGGRERERERKRGRGREREREHWTL